jgi:non-ribosomal peptide synthetase component F
MKMKNVEDLYQLSPLQQGMLFHTLYAPRSGIYCEQIEMTLRAAPDITAFKETWQQVIERHTILRTAFLWDGLEEPLQVVRQRVPLPWEELDLQGLSAAEQVERVRAFCQRDLLRDFDLSRAPLMRLTLLHLAPDHHHLVWTHHHLLLDGWSVALLIEEVSLCYTALRQGHNPPLSRPHPYRDYITWLQAQNLAEAERFWRRYLAGFSSPIPLVGDVAEEAKQVSPRSVPVSDLPIRRPEGRDCAEQELHLSWEVTDALRTFARRHQLTPGTLAQGAWALLLSRYSGETDIVFGTTVSTRPADLPGIETMIGLLINTLPARVHVSPDARLIPWLQQVQAEQAEARQYSYAPLIRIHEWCEVPRGQPLFESVLVVENYPTGTAQQPDTSIERRTVGETKWGIVQTNYSLMLAVVLSAQEQRLVLRATYSQRRFSQQIILRLLGHLQTLLEGMLSQPEQTLATFPLLSAAERQQLLVEWNAHRELDQPQICLHELFEVQVKQTPDAMALVYEQEQITYQELNVRANQLASHLRLAGAALETPVGICFEQTHESIVAILGVLKAGGMYIPLDPASPLERLTSILHNAGAALVLTQASLLERLPSQIVPCCVLQSAWQQIEPLSGENVKSGIHPANAAYLLYTSGSTGAPKGVIVEHRQLVSYAGAIKERVALVSPASFALLQPLAVDSCLTMLFSALLTGGTLHMISREKALDAESLAESFARSPVDYLKIAPSHLETLLGGTPHQCLLPRLGLIIGGESSQWEWAQQLRVDLPEGGELYNHYGPTEATVGSLVFQEWATEDRHLALTPLVQNQATFLGITRWDVRGTP